MMLWKHEGSIIQYCGNFHSLEENVLAFCNKLNIMKSIAVNFSLEICYIPNFWCSAPLHFRIFLFMLVKQIRCNHCTYHSNGNPFKLLINQFKLIRKILANVHSIVSMFLKHANENTFILWNLLPSPYLCFWSNGSAMHIVITIFLYPPTPDSRNGLGIF